MASVLIIPGESLIITPNIMAVAKASSAENVKYWLGKSVVAKKAESLVKYFHKDTSLKRPVSRKSLIVEIKDVNAELTREKKAITKIYKNIEKLKHQETKEISKLLKENDVSPQELTKIYSKYEAAILNNYRDLYRLQKNWDTSKITLQKLFRNLKGTNVELNISLMGLKKAEKEFDKTVSLIRRDYTRVFKDLENNNLDPYTFHSNLLEGNKRAPVRKLTKTYSSQKTIPIHKKTSLKDQKNEIALITTEIKRLQSLQVMEINNWRKENPEDITHISLMISKYEKLLFPLYQNLYGIQERWTKYAEASKKLTKEEKEFSKTIDSLQKDFSQVFSSFKEDELTPLLIHTTILKQKSRTKDPFADLDAAFSKRK